MEHRHAQFLRGLYPTWWRNGVLFLLFLAGIVLSTASLGRAMRRVDAARRRQLEHAQRRRRAERFSRVITRHLPNGRAAILDRDLR